MDLNSKCRDANRNPYGYRDYTRAGYLYTDMDENLLKISLSGKPITEPTGRGKQSERFLHGFSWWKSKFRDNGGNAVWSNAV